MIPYIPSCTLTISHITHSVNLVNLAANLSDWPVLGNQMVRNAQGSMSHQTPGFPQTYLWVWLFQHGWVQWMGHCPALQVAGWPWAGDETHHYSFPMAWQGLLCGLLVCLGSGPFCRSCSCWWWHWTRVFTSQHYKKLPGVGYSPWIFYKKINYRLYCWVPDPFFPLLGAIQ